MHALTGSPMSEGNRVTLLKNGVAIFPSMLAAIRDANRTINLEFYIYWDGEIGRKFAEALAEKARAGVAVKVILDAVGSAQMSQSLINFMARNGVDVEWYHPLRWYTLSTLNHRTHRKLLVVDGCVGFSGGVGIADDWLGDADAKNHWRDTVARVGSRGAARRRCSRDRAGRVYRRPDRPPGQPVALRTAAAPRHPHLRIPADDDARQDDGGGRRLDHDRIVKLRRPQLPVERRG